jgi:hypothetical protein
MSDNLEPIINEDDFDLVKMKQTQVKNILQTGLERVQSKKNNMDIDNFNKDRMILLNESYRDRQKEYIFLLVLVLVIFTISLALVFFKERLGFSTMVIDILIFLVIGSGLITAFNTLQGIFRRDEIDFSRIKQDSSVMIKPLEKDDKYQKAAESGSIINAATEQCVGPACCSPGYQYDTTIHKCKK